VSQAAAGDPMTLERGGQGAAGALLARYPLATLARAAGLKATEPLEALLSQPRYSDRLTRFLTQAVGQSGQGAAHDSWLPSTLSASSLDLVFRGVGLCWGLARLRGALNPQEMTDLRARFAPEVLHLADEGLADVRVPPALTLPPGIGWLSPESCRSFGQAVVLGWAETRHPRVLADILRCLGLEAAGHEIRRVAALDQLVESFMRRQEAVR